MNAPATAAALWQRYQDYYCAPEGLGLALDISRMNFPDGFIEGMEGRVQAAFEAMEQLEGGAIANPDEGRMVGHYWLREAGLAPTPEIAGAIRAALAETKRIAGAVHSGEMRAQGGEAFKNFVVVGIGGSALGPQLAADALGGHADKLRPFFVDNTDPDGIDRLIDHLGGELVRTLVVVISKSGGTPETRNGQMEVAAAFNRAGLDFAKAAIAVTGEGSKLDLLAKNEGWLARLPMWDWIGGRTSETSVVGLLPAALQGIDIDAFLEGARAMDIATRERATRKNPAALLALMWHHAGGGRGAKDMVILPYKDRLILLSRYLQQLVMESLGKELDLAGAVVHQGIAVYGNKGSTDQHAYVQQLREGVNNFFATFIEVLRDRAGEGLEVESGVTSGDYLSGLMLGTRRALFENGRESMTITVDEVSPRTLGMLIALFERAVGLYATLVGINAYHQPGVEAGKKAAAAVLALQAKAVAALGDTARTAGEIAEAVGAPDEVETIYKVLARLAANGRGVALAAGTSGPGSRFTRS